MQVRVLKHLPVILLWRGFEYMSLFVDKILLHRKRINAMLAIEEEKR